jgi:hypothetical protein
MDLDIEDLVAAVAARMRAAQGVCVFAVWRDGSVTKHDIGFRRRRGSDGHLEEPLATFVSGARLSRDKIRSRITRGLQARGL